MLDVDESAILGGLFYVLPGDIAKLVADFFDEIGVVGGTGRRIGASPDPFGGGQEARKAYSSQKDALGTSWRDDDGSDVRG